MALYEETEEPLLYRRQPQHIETLISLILIHCMVYEKILKIP